MTQITNVKKPPNTHPTLVPRDLYALSKLVLLIGTFWSSYDNDLRWKISWHHDSNIFIWIIHGLIHLNTMAQ